MAEIRIDREKRKLVIRAGNGDEGTVLLKLPSRRWMPKYGMFAVPTTRMNMTLLLQALQEGKIQLGLSESAIEALAYITSLATSGPGDRQFPADYKFKTKPFAPQWEALQKVYKNDSGALLMRMGTGKSKVIIDFMTARYMERDIRAAMVVCPLTVTGVWDGPTGELAVHSPLPYRIVHVDSSFDPAKIWALMNRDQKVLWWLLVGIESLSQGHTFDRLLPFVEKTAIGIAVDESSRIANHATTRTKRAFQLGRLAKNRLIATGTPVRRKLVDLYAQYEFLDPNIIGAGDYYAFRNRYAIMGGFKHRDIVGYDNVEELMGLIEPYTYRCDKPVGMPQQFWTERVVQLTPEQKEAYRKIKKAEMAGVTVQNVLSRVLRLQQVVGGFYSDDPKREQNALTGHIRTVAGVEHRLVPGAQNPKIRALHEIMAEADRPVIIWAKFKFEIADILEAMKPYGPIAVFTGDTPQEERSKIKEDFQKGHYGLLVGNQAVGGIGYTFTRAHVMVYYSNTYSLEDRLQSEDRIHRTGQDTECLYIDLIADKTVDRVIQGAIHEKKDLDQYVRDKLDQAGGRLDAVLGEV